MPLLTQLGSKEAILPWIQVSQDKDTQRFWLCVLEQSVSVCKVVHLPTVNEDRLSQMHRTLYAGRAQWLLLEGVGSGYEEAIASVGNCVLNLRGWKCLTLGWGVVTKLICNPPASEPFRWQRYPNSNRELCKNTQHSIKTQVQIASTLLERI